MNKNDYWFEAVESSLDEAGVAATKEQTNAIASDIDVAHEQYDMAFGYDVASQNYTAEKDQQIVDLRRELNAECEKMPCKTCKGRGEIVERGPYHSSASTCWKCKGNGRV